MKRIIKITFSFQKSPRTSQEVVRRSFTDGMCSIKPEWVVMGLKQIKEAVFRSLHSLCSFHKDNCDDLLQGNRRNILSYYLNVCAIRKKNGAQLPRHLVKTSGKLKVNLKMIILNYI